MTCEPITCNGNDLAAVCADIRLRGGCIEAMDVIGTAKYRVSYFEREDGLVSSRRNPSYKAIQRRTGVIDEPDMRPVTNVSEQPTDAGENPAALNPISIESRLAALQSKLLASGKIKRSKPKTMPDNYRQPYAD